MKFLLLLVAGAQASDVAVLTAQNFDEFVAQDLTVVEFYAPWCGHCKRLEPEWEKAATELNSNDPPVPLAKVDATLEPKLAGTYGVSGYPTIKIFRKGVASEYKGPREADGIVSFLKTQTGASATPMKSKDEFKAFLNEQSLTVVLGLFKDQGTSPKAAAFQKLADQMRDQLTFAITSDAGLMDQYGINDGIALVPPKIYKTKGEKNAMSTDNFKSKASLYSYLKKNLFPYVGIYNADTAKAYAKFGKKVFTLYYDVASEGIGKDSPAEELRTIAKSYEKKQKSGILFTVGDVSYSQGTAAFGGPPDANAIYALIKGQKYRYQSTEDLDGADKWIAKVIKGKAQPELKSDPVPAQATTNGLTVLVGANFAAETDGKDALIEFYAPWCGHCKALAPKWDELAAAMDGESVVIAKMDTTANDTPKGYNVRGFPTIYWKSKKGKLEAYKGGREVSDFKQFIAAKKSGKSTGGGGGKKKKQQKRQAPQDDDDDVFRDIDEL